MFKEAMNWVVITLRNHLETRNVIVLVIWIYLGGLLLFLSNAVWGGKIFAVVTWDRFYYVWDKSKDLLFLLALFKVAKPYRKMLIPIIFYSIIRVCYEIIVTLKTDTDTPTGINILFLIVLALTISISVKEINQEWNQK